MGFCRSMGATARFWRSARSFCRRRRRGTIQRAGELRVVSFEQNRESLDPALPLRRALAPHGDKLFYQGTEVHVSGYARRFLFRAEQLDMPLGNLSGGEQSRVLIARMML